MLNIELTRLELWMIVFGSSFILFLIRQEGFQKRRWNIRLIRWIAYSPENEDTFVCLVPLFLIIHTLVGLWLDPLFAYPWICCLSCICLCIGSAIRQISVFLHHHKILCVIAYLVFIFMGVKRPYLLAPAIIIDLLETMGCYLLSPRELLQLSNQYPFLLHEDNNKTKGRHRCRRKHLQRKTSRMDHPSPRASQERTAGNC